MNMFSAQQFSMKNGSQIFVYIYINVQAKLVSDLIVAGNLGTIISIFCPGLVANGRGCAIYTLHVLVDPTQEKIKVRTRT